MRRTGWLTAAMLCAGSALSAADYSTSFGYNPSFGGVGGGADDFGSLAAFFDSLSVSGLTAIDPTWDGITAIDITGDALGESIFVTVTDSGGAVASVSAFGEGASFTGATYDEALAKVVEWLRDRMSELTRLAIERTPTDPVAGNPASLQSRMLVADFEIGTVVGTQPEFSVEGAGGASVSSIWLAAANLGGFSSRGHDVSYVELPLSWAMPLDDPRYALILVAPIGIVDYDGEQAYNFSFGGGVRLPMLDNWTLTPTLRAGLATSTDAELTGYLFGASVVSNLDWEFESGIRFAMGNQIGISRSFGSTDYEDISNAIFRNGLEISGDTSMTIFGQPVSWDMNITNTRFTGDVLFIEDYTEIAVSVGTTNSVNGMRWDSLRLGLTYTFGDNDLEGLKLNFGYQF